MSDARFRQLERAAAAGDKASALLLHAARRRAGLPLLPDRVSATKRHNYERYVFPNNRGATVTSIRVENMKPHSGRRAQRQGRKAGNAEVGRATRSSRIMHL